MPSESATSSRVEFEIRSGTAFLGSGNAKSCRQTSAWHFRWPPCLRVWILERTGIRRLMATAFTDDSTRQRAAPVQPLGWLAKPYDHQDMVRALADARDRSRDLEL